MNFFSKLKYSLLFGKISPSIKINRTIKPCKKYEGVKIEIDSDEKHIEYKKEIQTIENSTKWTTDYTYPEDKTISKFKLKGN
jgi:hypothetical protein